MSSVVPSVYVPPGGTGKSVDLSKWAERAITTQEKETCVKSSNLKQLV